jgi:hypothetical protein
MKLIDHNRLRYDFLLTLGHKHPQLSVLSRVPVRSASLKPERIVLKYTHNRWTKEWGPSQDETE